jgi:hypothetical protein
VCKVWAHASGSSTISEPVVRLCSRVRPVSLSVTVTVTLYVPVPAMLSLLVLPQPPCLVTAVTRKAMKPQVIYEGTGRCQRFIRGSPPGVVGQDWRSWPVHQRRVGGASHLFGRDPMMDVRPGRLNQKRRPSRRRP